MLTTFTVQLELRLLVNEADHLTPLARSTHWHGSDSGTAERIPLTSVTQSNETVTVVFPNTVRWHDWPATSFCFVLYISLEYLVSFTMYVHPFTTALKKKFSPQNRRLRLCPKECVLISAQIKENKLCTHSRFFICRQTSLFIIWNFSILSLLEAQMAQVSVAKKSFFFL